jgi:hypothetical protein
LAAHQYLRPDQVCREVAREGEPLTYAARFFENQ